MTDQPTDKPDAAGLDDSRDIFPTTESMYKAFIDRMPTPIKTPGGSYVLTYNETLAAVQRASSYSRKNAKARLQAEYRSVADIERAIDTAHLYDVSDVCERISKALHLPSAGTGGKQ